jgi:Flp pilus assembly protein TadG
MAEMTHRSRGRRGERGAELIEFAFTLPLLLVVVLGIVDFGFMFQRYEVITNAAREGARVGILPGYAQADVVARVDQYVAAAGLGPAGTASTTVTPTSVTAGAMTFDAIQITVSYVHDHVFVGPLMVLVGGGSLGSVTLTSTATMRTESQAGAGS